MMRFVRLSTFRVGLACSLMVVVACEEPNLLPGGIPRPPLVWEGERVRISTDRSLEDWCPATLDRLDQFAAAMEESFGPAADETIDYYLLDHPLAADACPSPYGCTYRSDAGIYIISSLLPAEHELVHATKPGRVPSFFEEGIAGHLGGRISEAESLSVLDIRNIIETAWTRPISDDAEYALAAHFTSYLIHRHGLSTYALLHEHDVDSRAEFESKFETALGLSLEEAIVDYEGTYDVDDACRLRSTYYPLVECARDPQFRIGEESVTIDLDVSCGDPAAVGPLDQFEINEIETPRVWQSVTIDLDRSVDAWGDTASSILLDSPGADMNSARVEVILCSPDCSEMEANRTSFSSPIFDLRVRPGRYVVRVSRRFDDPGPVHIEWR